MIPVRQPQFGPIQHYLGITIYFIGPFLVNVVLGTEKETITSQELVKISLYLLNEGFVTNDHKKWLEASHKRINFLVTNCLGQKLVPHWFKAGYVLEGEDGKPENL